MWFLNLSVAFNLVYSKFSLQESKPTFDLTVFTYNSSKTIRYLGFTLTVESMLANKTYLSFYGGLIYDNHGDFTSE